MYRLFLTLMLAGVLAAQNRPLAGNPGERLQELSAKLNLTEEQKAQIKPILEEQAPKMKAIRDDSSLDRRGKMQKAMEVRSETDSKIRPILTKEQQDILDAEREKMRENMKKRRRG